MPEFDPGEYTIQELGPAVQEIEDVEELRALLEAEEAGEDRVGAKTLIESRIEKFEGGAEAGEDELDLSSMSVADVANAVRDIDDPEELRDLLDAEESGDDRDAIKTQIQNRLDSVTGGDEEDEEGAEEEPQTPEERHPHLDHPTADKQYVETRADGTYGDTWVYCETQAGGLLDVSREMLGKARELMDQYNEDYDAEERVVAVLVGAEVSDLVAEVESYGADVVVTHEDERLERFRHKPYAEIFCDAARQDDDWREYDEPRYVLFPATNNGRDLSAQAQAELDSGLASDCSGLYIEDVDISNPAKTGEPGSTKRFERVLHMKRPDFSGFEYSTILCLDKPDRDFHPQGGSVIPGSFEVPDPDPEHEAEVVEHDMDLPDDWFRATVEEFDRLEGGVDLTGYEVVVAMGRGIGDDPTEGIELGLDLVGAFDDAALGLSRGVVTASYNFEGHVEQYVTEERQIGESGQVVEPQLYVAAGISGAIQHKVGMDESDVIVAINTDPDADIREFSDYFVEGDLFDVLPRLTEALEAGEVDAAAVADGGERE